MTRIMSYEKNNQGIRLDDLGVCYQLRVVGLYESTLTLSFKDYRAASRSFDCWVEIIGRGT